MTDLIYSDQTDLTGTFQKKLNRLRELVRYRFDKIWILSYYRQSPYERGSSNRYIDPIADIDLAVDQAVTIGGGGSILPVEVHTQIRTPMDRWIIEMQPDSSNQNTEWPLYCTTDKEVNITLGHLAIYNKADLCGNDRILVLEEDALLCKDIDYLIHAFENMPDDYDYINFISNTIYYDRESAEFRKNQSADPSVYVKCSDNYDIRNGAMYAISKEGRKKCYDQIAKDHRIPVADAFYRFFMNDGKCYMINHQSLAIQNQHDPNVESWYLNNELYYSPVPGMDLREYFQRVLHKIRVYTGAGEGFLDFTSFFCHKQDL